MYENGRTRTRGTYQRWGEVRGFLDAMRGSVYAIKFTIKFTPETKLLTNQLKM
jgi:hypothetical protein